MDIAKLQTLIDSDAANATKTQQQIADWCNARVMPAPVPAQDVAQYLVAAGLMTEIVLASRESVDVDGLNRPKIKAATDMVTAIESLQSFDLSIPAYLARITAALDALITHGFMTETHKAQILALGDNKRTRAEVEGLSLVTGEDVSLARRSGLTPWRVTFKPNADGVTGHLTAVFDEGLATEFMYSGSVNITDDASVADFIETAKASKARVTVDEVAGTVAQSLAAIEERMNS